MLVRYKNDHEKVAMGLLSFMPNEKDVKHLQHTMQAYNTNPNWHLYLWREDAKNIGAIGLRIEDHFEMVVQDRKSTRLNSSHVAISYAVVCLYTKRQIIPTFICRFDSK